VAVELFVLFTATIIAIGEFASDNYRARPSTDFIGWQMLMIKGGSQPVLVRRFA
jgi:hypothetical protein